MAKNELPATTPAKDDELDEIMDEIEELQGEMDRSAKPAAADLKLVSAFKEGAENEVEPDHSDLEEFKAGSDEASLEETLGDLKEEPALNGSSLLDGGAASASPGTLSMTLAGQMTLKLKYDFEGQEVTVSFDDQILCVELTDGTQFRIPVGKRRSAA